MKKLIFFLICVVCATSALSKSCNNGTLIISQNGEEFCMSNNSMNWLSAFAWCEAQNLNLADFSKMCPGTATISNPRNGACSNLQGVGPNQWVWSSWGTGSSSALLVNLSSGTVDDYARNNTLYDGNAFCE